jgi:hypothetical protein
VFKAREEQAIEVVSEKIARRANARTHDTYGARSAGGRRPSKPTLNFAGLPRRNTRSFFALFLRLPVRRTQHAWSPLTYNPSFNLDGWIRLAFAATPKVIGQVLFKLDYRTSKVSVVLTNHKFTANRCIQPGAEPHHTRPARIT